MSVSAEYIRADYALMIASIIVIPLGRVTQKMQFFSRKLYTLV